MSLLLEVLRVWSWERAWWEAGGAQLLLNATLVATCHH